MISFRFATVAEEAAMRAPAVTDFILGLEFRDIPEHAAGCCAVSCMAISARRMAGFAS
jgi:hypothetical protein